MIEAAVSLPSNKSKQRHSIPMIQNEMRYLVDNDRQHTYYRRNKIPSLFAWHCWQTSLVLEPAYRVSPNLQVGLGQDQPAEHLALP